MFSSIEQAVAIVPMGYAKWRQDNFPEGTPEEQMALSACLVGDEISNLMKYAMGLFFGSVMRLNTMPTTVASRRLDLSFPINSVVTDVRYIVECPRDCKTWTMF